MQSIRLGFVLFASVVLGATNPLIVVRQALFTNFVWLMGKSGRGFCMDCIDRCPDPNAKSILPEDSVIRQAVTVALVLESRPSVTTNYYPLKHPSRTRN